MTDTMYGVTYANLDTLYFEDRSEAQAFATEWHTEVFDVDPTCLPADAEVFAPMPSVDWLEERLPELTPEDSLA